MKIISEYLDLIAFDTRLSTGTNCVPQISIDLKSLSKESLTESVNLKKSREGMQSSSRIITKSSFVNTQSQAESKFAAQPTFSGKNRSKILSKKGACSEITDLISTRFADDVLEVNFGASIEK